MSHRPTGIIEPLSCDYYVSLGSEETQRRRKQHMREIRKSKCYEYFEKMRQVPHAKQLPTSLSNSGNKSQSQLGSIPSMVAGLLSGNSKLQLQAIIKYQELLSVDQNPPIKEVIESRAVPILLEFLGREEFPQLQFEAAWALANMCSRFSEGTISVVSHGGVHKFILLLVSPSRDICEQAVWALGNVARHSAMYRDLILSSEALIPLLVAMLNETTNLSMCRNATWTLSNLCRRKPYPKLSKVRSALPTFERLTHLNDEEVLRDVCWAIFALSDGTDDKIQALIEANVCHRIVELLDHRSLAVLLPAICTIGNFVSGDDSQTQHIIKTGGLPFIRRLLTGNHENRIKEEACWNIANINVGDSNHVQAVIKAGLIKPLLNVFQNASSETWRAASWAVASAIHHGTREQIKYLVSEGCIDSLCDALLSPYPCASLEALEDIVKAAEDETDQGNTRDMYLQFITDAGGLQNIVSLLNHKKDDVRKMARKLHKTLIEWTLFGSD